LSPVTGTFTLVLQHIAGLCVGTFVVSDSLGTVADPVKCSPAVATPILPTNTIGFSGSSLTGQLIAVLSPTPVVGLLEATFTQR
jgi:hypothetical protein